MKIIGVVMVYNCDEVVSDALKDLDGRVDEIHCFEGKWAGMRCKTADHSTDKTKEVILEFSQTSKSKVTFEATTAGLWESEARTLSIKDIEIGDWVLVLDSDERIVKWNDDVYSILAQSDRLCYALHWDDSVFPVCRFFKKVEGMKYTRTDRVCSPKIGIYNEYLKEHRKMIGITIHHSEKKRKIPKASEFTQRPHP